VVTLVESGDATSLGVAYRVPARSVPEILARLDHREQGGYVRLDMNVHSNAGTVKAMTYVATEQNPNWLGEAPLPAIARQVNDARGPSGSNREYVLELARALLDLEHHDPHVHDLAQLVSRSPARQAR
jgi:cation transport regulator ChaC